MLELTASNHPRSKKILYVEKNDLKLSKNRFFGYGILTTFRNSYFSTINIENNYNKVYNARSYIKDYVKWCAHYKFMTLRIDAINYWLLDKNYTFFETFFWMDIMMAMVREDVLTTFFGSTWSRATNRKADTSTERACQSK